MRPARKFSGHRGVSEFVSSDPEVSVFRGFRTLGSRNLLHLQSELLEFEKRLNEFDEQDIQDKGNMDVLLSTACWETFSARVQEFPREAERMELIKRIREKTKEYCKPVSGFPTWLVFADTQWVSRRSPGFVPSDHQPSKDKQSCLSDLGRLVPIHRTLRRHRC